VAEEAVIIIIIAISVDPPPIIVASARTSRKGISEKPPILNPSAPLNTVASATVPSAPSDARNGAGQGLARAVRNHSKCLFIS
jgi:hypothetical protein